VVRLTSFKPNELGGAIPGQHRLPLLAAWFGYGKYKELQAVQGKFLTRFVRGVLKTVYLLITITVVVASHPHLGAQQVTTQATPGATPGPPDEPGATSAGG
jgi:hypothetical protein